MQLTIVMVVIIGCLVCMGNVGAEQGLMFSNSTTTPTCPPVMMSLQDFCNCFNVQPVNCSCDSPLILSNPNAVALLHIIGACVRGGQSTVPPIKGNTTIRYPSTLEKTRASIIVVASTCGIAGNAMILMYSFKKRKELPICKMLIALLAACDLTFSVFYLVHVIPFFWTSRWLYGEVACKIFKGLDSMGSFLAIGVILIISIERYIGIVYPFRHGLKVKEVHILLGINVLVSIAFITPSIVTSKVDKELHYCYKRWSWPKAPIVYNWIVFLLVYLIPVIVMCILFISIIRFLKMKSQTMSSYSGGNQRLEEKRAKDNKRITTILVSVLVTYLFLVLPNRIVAIVVSHSLDNHSHRHTFSNSTISVLEYIMLVPYPFHVMVNPIVYSLVDARVRRDVKKMVGNFCSGCFHHKNSNEYNHERNRAGTGSCKRGMTPCIDADAKIRANTALSSLNSTPCSTPVMCRRIADSKIRANSALSLTKSALCSTPDINSGMP